jgi:hypothetical protein
MSDNLNESNIVFLRFVDKLQLLFCFNKPWRTEGLNVVEATNRPTKYVLDNPTNKLDNMSLRAWTDGS